MKGGVAESGRYWAVWLRGVKQGVEREGGEARDVEYGSTGDTCSGGGVECA